MVSRLKTQQGFSLLEVIIAVGIGSILIAILTKLYVDSRKMDQYFKNRIDAQRVKNVIVGRLDCENTLKGIKRRDCLEERFVSLVDKNSSELVRRYVQPNIFTPFGDIGVRAQCVKCTVFCPDKMHYIKLEYIRVDKDRNPLRDPRTGKNGNIVKDWQPLFSEVPLSCMPIWSR